MCFVSYFNFYFEKPSQLEVEETQKIMTTVDKLKV